MNKIVNVIEQILFPKNYQCIVCGDEIFDDRKYQICDRCMQTLPFITGNYCRKCGGKIRDMGKVCIHCKNATHKFSQNFTIFNYAEPVDSLIRNLKFKNQLYINDTLSNFLATRIIETGKNFDLIVPVPMFPGKLKKRGFNQSWLLCNTIRELGLNARDDVLLKIRDTKAQVDLGLRDRLTNLEGAFKVADRSAVKGKVVLIVDDVITTGSTINECAQALLDAGAKKIYSATLCRARGDDTEFWGKS